MDSTGGGCMVGSDEVFPNHNDSVILWSFHDTQFHRSYQSVHFLLDEK